MAVAPTEIVLSSTADRVVQSMRRKLTACPLPTGVAIENGTPVACQALTKIFEILGITVGTVHIDGSFDQTTWTTLGNVTADGFIHNSQPWPFIRARISAWTSGTIVVRMCE